MYRITQKVELNPTVTKLSIEAPLIARKAQPGDVIIIMSYAMMDFEEAKTFKPTVIFPDTATNRLV